ncbi:MAG: abortive infection family protein [Treponema sp.]|nr:abortive infection family protein [Treponema sp.]
MEISPKYQMALIDKIEKRIWELYVSYNKVTQYIKKWIVVYNDYTGDCNFVIKYKKDSNIDLLETLSEMDGELLLKIAIDLDIDTPDFIPMIPTFKNEIKSSYDTANTTFDKAFKLIYEDPSTAIGLANSALESILKHILSDNRISVNWDKNDTLYSLTCSLLKEFKLSGLDDNYSKEVKTIGSSILSACQSIEKLRSDKTLFHGKQEEDIIIDDSMYTYFIINSVCTIGKFCISFYEKNYPKESEYTNTFSDFLDCPF